MTTITEPAVTPGLWNRVAAVFRLHFVNPVTVLGMPWFILSMIFLGNLIVWALIGSGLDNPADRRDVAEGFQWSGASLFIFFYMMVVAIQAINATFSFALGLSVTRRDYYLGTAVSFVVLSLIFSTGMAILAALETATGGWGLGGRMFTAVYFGDGTWFERWIIFFLAFLFFFFFGTIAGGVYVRWKGIGVTLFVVGITFVLIGLAAIFTLTQTWGSVGAWFAANGWVGSYAWSLVLTALSAVAGFLLLRKATPRG